MYVESVEVCGVTVMFWWWCQIHE